MEIPLQRQYTESNFALQHSARPKPGGVRWALGGVSYQLETFGGVICCASELWQKDNPNNFFTRRRHFVHDSGFPSDSIRSCRAVSTVQDEGNPCMGWVSSAGLGNAALLLVRALSSVIKYCRVLEKLVVAAAASIHPLCLLQVNHISGPIYASIHL